MATDVDNGKKRLLLVSDNLPRFEDLIRAALDNVVVVPIQFNSWKLNDLYGAIKERAGDPTKQYASIGILEHGAPGYFCLLKSINDGVIKLHELRSNPDLKNFFTYLGKYVQAPKELGKWREDLHARIDLLSCSTAAGQEGMDLITYLEDITQVNWAASINNTGAGEDVENGFDWIMETEKGLGSVHTGYFNDAKIHAWKYHLASFSGGILSEQEEMKITAEAGQEFTTKLLSAVADEEDNRPFAEKYKWALALAGKKVAHFGVNKATTTAVNAIVNKALTATIAKTVVGTVALQGGRRGAVTAVAGTMGTAAQKALSGAAVAGGTNSAAQALKGCSSANIACIAGELTGRYVIPWMFPSVNAEAAAFLGSCLSGAGAGAFFGGPWGAAGGAVMGGVSYTVGAVGTALLGTVWGTDQYDMTFEWPPPAENEKDFPWPTQILHYDKSVQLDACVTAMFSCNKEELFYTVPAGYITTKIEMIDNWKNAGNGTAVLNKVENDQYVGPTLPTMGPTQLRFYIEALTGRGLDWTVRVHIVKLDDMMGFNTDC